MALAALGVGSCAESPVSNPAYGPGFSATAARPVRLELTAYDPDGRCSSPFPLTQLRAKLFTGDGKAYATPIFLTQGPDTAEFPLPPLQILSGRPGPLPCSEPAPVRRLFRDELAHGVPVLVRGALEPTANRSI